MDAKQIVASLPDSHLQFPENHITSWLNWLAAWMALAWQHSFSGCVPRVNAARNENAARSSSGRRRSLCFVLHPTHIHCLDDQPATSSYQYPFTNVTAKAGHGTNALGLQILFFGSVVSAILSTCNWSHTRPTSLLAENIIKPLWPQKLSDSKLLLVTRLSTITMGLLALWVCLGRWENLTW